MKALRSIKISVSGPFEDGGFVKIFDGAKQVLPAIYLRPIPKQEKSYSGEADRDDGYILSFQRIDLPHVIFAYLPNWNLVEGGPKEKVEVDIETEEV